MASEENPVVKAALDLLPLYGVEVWRNQSHPVPGRRFTGRKGVSDVLGFTRSAKFVAVELKKPGGKLSEEQVEFLKLVKAAGGVAIAAYSIDDFQKQLESYRLGGMLC